MIKLKDILNEKKEFTGNLDMIKNLAKKKTRFNNSKNRSSRQITTQTNVSNLQTYL